MPLKDPLRMPKAWLRVAGAVAAVWLETVVAQPALVNSYLPDAVYGQAYSANLMVGGTPPPTSVTVTGLPSGLTAVHNGSGSVAFSGATTEVGEFRLIIAATNANGTASTSVPLAVHRYAAVSSLAWDGLKQGCAVVDGGVQCFGQGFLDATGTSAATASEPMQLIAAGSGATVVAGSPGEYRNGGTHYCAVVNGGVWCWGNNEFGQIGNKSTTNSAVPVNVIPAGSDTFAVSVGVFEDELGQRLAAQSCAVVDGGLQCWGRYEAGPGQESSLAPTWVIARNSGVTALSATYGHTCVVLSGGVQCFGVDRYGETGGGGVFPTGSGATTVATGLGHSCALVGVRVHCWGSNAYGQLGVYTQSDRTSTPVTRDYFLPVTELTAGYLHTCTLDKDSVVSSRQLCWGQIRAIHTRVAIQRTVRCVRC
jgi:hypothetical protein